MLYFLSVPEVSTVEAAMPSVGIAVLDSVSVVGNSIGTVIKWYNNILFNHHKLA